VNRDSPTVLLRPGDTFGEAMLVDGRPSGGTVRAVTDTELYVLRRADYLDVLGQRSSRPAFGFGPWLGWLALAVLVLAIVAVLLGIFLGGDLLSGLALGGSQPIETPTSIQTSSAVQIVAPQPGEVLEYSTSLLVQAILTEPGFSEAALQVDGVRQAVHVNSDLDASPWIVEWGWEEVSEGSHTLSVQARYRDGEWRASEQVVVTVVPAGLLAFASNRDGSQAIYTMRTDGRNVTRWTSGPDDARQPSWGGEGLLAYVAEPEIGQPVIRQVASAGGEAIDLFPGRDPDWSPSGVRLAFAATVDGVSQVFTVIATGEAPFQVTEEETYAGKPTWSPDGRRLAYAVERDGNWDIWVAGLDGSEPGRLTKDPDMDWAPAWSPDGSQLAFVSNRGGSHQIYVMRDDGSSVQALTDFPFGAEAPAWSPTGLWLAFVAYTGEGEGVNAREIYLMRSDGREQVRLTYNAFDDSQPDWTWSP
jgi:TolB protein